MTEQKNITASCIISNNVVFKNENPLYENKVDELSDFLIDVYRHFELKYPKFYKMDNLYKCIAIKLHKETSTLMFKSCTLTLLHNIYINNTRELM